MQRQHSQQLRQLGRLAGTTHSAQQEADKRLRQLRKPMDMKMLVEASVAQAALQGEEAAFREEEAGQEATMGPACP